LGKRPKPIAPFLEGFGVLPHKMDSDRLSKAIVALVELVARLRSPGGCPWDAKQTDASVKVYLLEEAYEVLDAVEKSSPQEVCLELGDLLFQILFLAQLASERREFDFTEVVEKITEKMIRRHPHVFGRTKVNDAEEVAHNWAKIKKAEEGTHQKKVSALRTVPTKLPALLRGHRLTERASKLNPHWENKDEAREKVQRHFEGLKAAIRRQDRDFFYKEMGHLIFSLVNLSRLWGFNAEDLLRTVNQEFLACFEKTESELESRGIELGEATSDQMKSVWEKIKKKMS
jgi:MazG family protein